MNGIVYTFAQSPQGCQLVIDPEFDNYAGPYQGDTEPVCNFLLDNVLPNTPDRFIGDTGTGDPAGNLFPFDFCFNGPQPLIMPSWNGNPQNIFFRIISKLEPTAGFSSNGSEGITMQLFRKTMPKCVYDFNIRVASGCARRLFILFSDNPPCPKSTGIPIGYNGASTNCGGSPDFNVGEVWQLDVSANTNWQLYNLNDIIDGSYEYITIYSSFVDGAPVPFNGPLESSCLIDDVRLTERAPMLTWKSEPKESCIGGKVEIEYEVCIDPNFNPNTNPNVKPTSVALTPNIPLGMKLSSNCIDFKGGSATFDLPDPKGNLCKTLNLILDVDATTYSINSVLDFICSIKSNAICSPTIPNIVTPLVMQGEDPDFKTNTIPCPSLTLTPVSDVKGSTHTWTVVDDKTGLVVSTSATNPTLPQGNYSITHRYKFPCGSGFGETIKTKKATVKCDPCECPSGIVVGTTGQTTLLSQTKFYKANSKQLANTCFTVNGTLVIDADYNFSNVRFFMRPWSKIEVKTAKTLSILEKSHLSGCEQMWYGIKLYPSSNLIFTDNTIEDALYAIELADKANISIKRNQFIANRTGIYFAATPTGAIQSVATKNDVITGNTFSSNGKALKSPHIGGKGSGLELNNCSLDIGFYSTGIGNPQNTRTNTFKDLDEAIIFSKSSIRAASLIIDNITYDGISENDFSLFNLRTSNISNVKNNAVSN